ncbi:MAG: HNH endonuclease [Mariniphaga sp.]
MVKIQDYINDRNKYEVDTTYQRPINAWSNEDNQCFIDTILRGEPIPMFFLNYLTKEKIYYIVDGQQRLNCITKFYDNDIKLNGKFSGNINHGKTFNKSNPLDDDQKYNFLNYKLNFHILEDYDDERVRLIFSRLQRGKALQLGECLNAKPGKIVECMRELADHPFLKKSIGVAKNRYGVYPDAARILFYEKHGARQCGTEELYKFFDDYKDLDKNSKEQKYAKTILNFLEKCFPADPGDYKYIGKHAWVLAIYSMIRDIKSTYSLTNKEQIIKEFIENFHGKVYSEAFRSSNQNLNYQHFYDNVRGGWSEAIIKKRRNILKDEFLKKNNLPKLDGKRQITDEEKISAYSKKPFCTGCMRKFKDYKEAEYHHVERYSDGGATELNNIIVLCPKCHDKIHSGIEIEKTSEEEPEQLITTKSKGVTTEKIERESKIEIQTTEIFPVITFPPSDLKIKLNSVVKIKYLNKEKEISIQLVEYHALGLESNNGIQKININSPFALSIIGKTLRDKVEINNTNNLIEILEIVN